MLMNQDYANLPWDYGLYPWSTWEPLPKVTSLMQSMMILDQFWSSHSDITGNQSQRNEWRYSRHQMRDMWTRPVLETMLLLSALVSCKIAISAYDWADKHFILVSSTSKASVCLLLCQSMLSSLTWKALCTYGVQRDI